MFLKDNELSENISRVGCPNQTEPNQDWNRNKISEKLKPQTAIFSQNHSLRFLQEIKPKNDQNCSIWTKYKFFPKIYPFLLLNVYIRWLISLKFLVCLQEYAEFDKTWSSKLTFISTETETANQTKPQYSQSETDLEPVQHIAVFWTP